MVGGIYRQWSGFFLICAMFLTPLSLSSQNAWSYGIKAGAVLANQERTYHDSPFLQSLDTETRWGIDAGIFVGFMGTSTLSFVGEIHYIQKGFGLTGAVTTADGPEIVGYTKLRWRYDYLTIPILLKVRYETESVSPYIIIGPRVDLLLGEFEPEWVLPIDYKTATLGGSLGLGTEIVLVSLPTVFVEFRYSPDFTTAFEGEFVDIKGYSFEFLLGMEF